MTSIETTPVVDKVTTYDETQAVAANITKTVEIGFHEHIGQTGNPQTRSGGNKRAENEYILENGQQYIIVVESEDNNDNHHVLKLNFYEHTDLN